MVVQIETIFTNGLILPATKDLYFLGDAGIDGYTTVIDQGDINVDIIKISLEGLLRSSLIKLRAAHRARYLGEHYQVYRMACRCAGLC